jgi:hypothetical protein
VNPVTGQRENRNRIPRAVVGFNNALWVTGDQKYVDAWRRMISAVNANAKTTDGRRQYPTMYGEQGWYGWQAQPWNVGAMEVWYWSMQAGDLARVAGDPWVRYLQGQNPGYPETALHADLATMGARVERMRQDVSTADQRLADNMMDFNPAAVDAMIRLSLGGLPPGRDGGLLNARLRYFDPSRKRAGLPEDVAALVTRLADTGVDVTLVNLNPAAARTVIVQGGAYGEHRIESVRVSGTTTRVRDRSVSVTLKPGAGAVLSIEISRYAAQPTASFPKGVS